MNELQIFNSPEFGQVRTVVINGNPYFVASDVAKALGYARPNNAVNMHCKHATLKQGIITDSIGRVQNANVIPEGDLYRLVSHSELPTAEKFESWIFDEVLPSIRQTGTCKIQKDPKTDRTEIMLLNARTRTANTYLKMANVAGLPDPYRQVLLSKAAESQLKTCLYVMRHIFARNGKMQEDAGLSMKLQKHTD